MSPPLQIEHEPVQTPRAESAPSREAFEKYARTCRTPRQFKRLLILLRTLIPYQSLVCAWGYPYTYRIMNVLSLGYPRAFLRWYFSEGMLPKDPVFAEWLRTREPLLWGQIARKFPDRFDRQYLRKVQEYQLLWSLGGGTIEKNDHDVGCYFVLPMASEEEGCWCLKLFGELLPYLTHAFERSYPRGMLTERERAVLKLRTQGHQVKSIAAELHISPRTVKMHVEGIKKKLYTDDLLNAVVIALKLGMIE